MRIFKPKGEMKMIQAPRERSKCWYWWRMLPKSAFLWIFIWIFIGALAIILVLKFACATPLELLIALLGPVLAAIFQISAAYHAKVSHFLECFSRCNESYAKLNGLLREPSPPIRACNSPAVANGPSESTIDLCAEEYLMHQMGVIPHFVWAVDNGSSDAIIDYFNLCAEEYLMHKMGVIPDFVWDVWREGIHGLALKEHIHEAWIEEKKAKCDYYGFDLKTIMQEYHDVHGRECKMRDHCPWGLSDPEEEPCNRRAKE